MSELDLDTAGEHRGIAGGWPSLVGIGGRSDTPVAAVLIALLAVIGFVSVSAPRLLAEAEADSLEQSIDGAQPSVRRLSIRLIDNFQMGFDRDPLEEQQRALDRISSQFEPAILDAFADGRVVADTNRFAVAATTWTEPAVADDGTEIAPVPVAPALPTFLTFRLHPELDDHSRIVDGRPAVRSDVEHEGYAVFEFELSTAGAEQLGLAVGDRILLTTDTTDTVTRQFDGGLPDDFVAELAGIRELDAVDDPYWFGDARLHRPTVNDTGIGATVFAFAAISLDQVPVRPFAIEGFSPFSLEERRDLVSDRVDLDNVDSVLAGLNAIEAGFADRPTLNRPGVATSLAPVLETEAEQRRAADTAVTLAAIGVIGVAIATLAQLLMAAFSRRRGWLTVARARGATRRQLMVSTAAEVAMLSVVGLAAGAAVAMLVVGGARTETEITLLGATFVGAVAVALALAWVEERRPVTADARATEPAGGRKWVRVGSGVLVTIAAASAVTFRRRGVAVDAPELDVLVVMLPIVVPLAIVVSSQWILPRVLGAVAARGLHISVGRLVGLRRAAASPSTGVAVVLTLALTVGALGVGVFRALDRGAVDASWGIVGAPYRIDTRDMVVFDAVSSIDGVRLATQATTRTTLLTDGDGTDLQFYTVDTAELAGLTAGTAADPQYPAELVDEPGEGVVPVIAAERINGQRVRLGDEFLGAGSRDGQVFRVVETRPELFGRRTGWLLADATSYERVTGTRLSFNRLYLDVPADREAALLAAADGSGVEVLSRASVLAGERDDPLSRAVRAGYLVAAGLALVISLVALTAIVVVTARQRKREVAVLGLLGAGGREIRRAVATELLPVVLFGGVIGACTGWAVVKLYEGRIDLSSFAAGAPVTVSPSLILIAGVTLALLAAAGALVAVAARRVVRTDANELLRIDGAT